MKLNISVSIDVLFFMVLLIRHISSRNECFRMSSEGIEEICCDNYVKRNGVCVECTTGTRSKNEEECIPCSAGTYGRRCSRMCKCKMNERCDRFIGCVFDNDVSTLKAKTDTRTTPATSHRTYRKTMVNHHFVSTTSIQKPSTKVTKGTTEMYEYHTHIGTEEQHYRTSKDRNANKTVITEVFTNREMVIYAAGFSCVLLLVILLCFGFVLFYKYKNNQVAKIKISRRESLKGNEISADDEDSSLYASINEDEIYDDNIQIIYSDEGKEVINNQASESDRSSPKSENSGYLHPYTTVVKDYEPHIYCKELNYNDTSSESSVPNDTKRDSGYFHPYQQLQVKQIPKSEYSELVQYFEVIDIDTSLTNSTNQSFTKHSELNQNGFKALSPLLLKNRMSRDINKYAFSRSQSSDIILHSIRNCSLLSALYRNEKICINDVKSPNVKHVSV